MNDIFVHCSFTQVILSVLFIMASSKAVELSKEESQALEAVSNGANKFAVTLFKALASKKSGNLIVSPLSVQMVLAMAYTGAKGNTASEVVKLLSLSEKIDDTYLGYSSLIKTLQNPVLNMANRMFVDASASIKPEFQKNAEKYFSSPAESVDFQGACEDARQRINGWVQQQTKNKITDLLAKGTIDSLTRLILVNAIHFKADWQHKFLEAETKEEPFYVSKTETKKVQMMHAKREFGFRHDDELQAKILELEYVGNQFRMLVILPDEMDGLAKLEAKLENINLAEKVRYMGRPKVTVALPKFKLEETMELKEILKSLGVPTMFTSGADFSGMADIPLVVASVVQKAFVEVNEQGTEAAAATGLVMDSISFDLPQVFTANHPFTFLILSGSVCLFIGNFVAC